jgi:hypothetical protein
LLKTAPKPKPEATKPGKLVGETPPEHKFINNFPRAKVEGIRKVPFLVHANGIPIIRYKKPQPQRLSKYINGQIKAHVRRIEYRSQLDDYLVPIAESEDEWDSILRRYTALSIDDRDVNGSFSDSMHQARIDLENRMSETGEKLHGWVRTMTGIILAERELAAKEEKERRSENK